MVSSLYIDDDTTGSSILTPHDAVNIDEDNIFFVALEVIVPDDKLMPSAHKLQPMRAEKSRKNTGAAHNHFMHNNSSSSPPL